MRRLLALLLLACSAMGCGRAAHAADELRFRLVEGVDGVPLNVVEAGDVSRPAILLLHGIGQSYLSFENQLHSPLATEFHLVAFDLRGHGNSGKPWNREAYVDPTKWAGDVQRVMAATGLRKPVLLGWSYGTLVAADYLRHVGASTVSGIVLVSAFGGLTPPPQPAPPEIAAQMKRSREARESANLEQNISASRSVAHQLTAKEMPPEWIERATLIGMMLPASAHRWMFEQSFANQDLVVKIGVPLLIIVGGKNFGTSEADARDLVNKVPGAAVSVYPESGHSPFAEEPARFNRELAEFARRAFAGAQALPVTTAAP
jgi:non-heme chloroperoxidase